MPLNITILGLGPVGGSLGLVLGTLDPSVLDVGRPVITGWDADKRTMAAARGRLAADRVEANLVAAVREADVVVVAVPFDDIRYTFEQIAPVLKPGVIVTDTAPSKAQVLRWATELLPTTVDFIGGHPLAGFGDDLHRASAIDALRDSIYCLVPLPRTLRTALDGVEALVNAIGAKPYYIDAQEHDSYVAAAAHLPLAASVALMQTVSDSGGWTEIQPMAGEALLRATELASADTRLAAGALAGNAAAVEGWIDRLIGSLAELRGTLHDPAAVQALIERTQDARDRWLRSAPNLRPGENAFHGATDDVERPNLSGLFFGRRRLPPDRNKRR